MPHKNLANNLRFLRSEKGISQEKLANDVGVKRSSIAAYECKGVQPKLSVLIRIAKYFDIDLTDLLEKKLSENNSVYQQFLKNEEDGVSELSDKNDGNTDQTLSKETYSAHLNRIDKIVEGFKTYFEFKLKQEKLNEETKKIRDDVKHFISILEHILESNKRFRDENISNEA